MKYRFIIIPVVAIVSATLAWVGIDTLHQPSETSYVQPLDPQNLFSQSEESLRRITRHGDSASIPVLQRSLNQLNVLLNDYRTRNVPADKALSVLAAYEHDTAAVSDKIAPHLEALHDYDTRTDSDEPNFERSIQQIGLYELKTTVQTLERIHRDFIKNPSEAGKNRYHAESDQLKTIITELYLDESIEKPLMTSIDNRRRYFDALADAYADIGYERIHRLRSNAYALRTELQLLPAI